MSYPQLAANQLGQSFGRSVSHLPNTDIFGIVIDGLPNQEKAFTMADQLSNSANIHPVQAKVNGKTFLGFSVRPQTQGPKLAKYGISLQSVNAQGIALDKPLYGGSWSCYGRECGTKTPSTVDLRYRGLGGKNY